MATNFIQPGQVLTLTAPAGGVTSGTGRLIGALFVIALHDAPEGAPFEGQCTGVWELPKTSAQAWTEGAAIYWNGTAATTADGSGSNTLIGHAAAAAANPSATGKVRLSA
jgi:predicted RecA/RadA family phage recombinase